MLEVLISTIVGILATIVVAALVYLRQSGQNQEAEAKLRAEISKLRAETAGMEELRKRHQQLIDEIKGLASAEVIHDGGESFMVAANELDGDVELAIDSLPAKVSESKDKLAGVEGDEMRAQLIARNLDDSIRPSLHAALSLCHQTVMKACERGLVGCKELTGMEIPPRTMGSAAEVRGKRRSEHSGFRFVSEGGTEWNVYIELGHAKSPPALAEWREAHDHCFPMIRVEEDGKPLATVAFDPLTREVRVASNMSSETDAIEKILDIRTAANAIGPVLIHLLRQIRIREEI